jgi:hypothetical protein
VILFFIFSFLSWPFYAAVPIYQVLRLFISRFFSTFISWSTILSTVYLFDFFYSSAAPNFYFIGLLTCIAYLIMADTNFNLAQVAPRRVGGYDRATRAGITGADQIKLKETACKKILKQPLSATRQVTTFDPSEMHESSNFFNFIGGWRSNVMTLQQHCTAYYMHNVFMMCRIGPDPNQPVMGANNTPVLDANGNPTFADRVIVTDNLFESWHFLTMAIVAESVRIYAEHAEDVDRQNLQWSWEFILANVDSDLRHFIIAEVEKFPSHIGQTGPMAFFIAANKIMTSTTNLAHNVITGVMLLELRHFEGEDVTECVFVLRNVLKFLNYGHQDRNIDKTPPTIMDNLYDVFIRASNPQFRSYLRNLKDFHEDQINTPERLFSKVQDYYNSLLTKPGYQWLPTKKKKASFLANSKRVYETDSGEDVEPGVRAPKSPPKTQKSYAAAASRETPKYVVDRTPPAKGEPKTRKNDRGYDEHWCSKCPNGGRWGNHLESGHDEWYKSFLEKKQKKKEAKSDSKSGSSSDEAKHSSPPSSMSKSSASANPVSPLRSLLRRQYVSFQDSDSEGSS